jgi:short-subunit dehydrogenase
VVINNAGIGIVGSLLERPQSAIIKTFEVNIISHFLIIREFLPAMIKNNHGHIVTVASLASFGPQLGLVDYASSKAGALAFHEGLSQELKWLYNAPKVRTT